MNNDEEHIRRRAYEIWEQEGRPQGEDLNHWVKALQEIGAKAEAKPRKAGPAKKTKSAPKSDDKAAAPSPAATAAAPTKAGKAKATTSATRH